MKITGMMAVALAGAIAMPIASRAQLDIRENFISNPMEEGWKIFGETNLFDWDAAQHDLKVTWDSTQPNSYFYHALGTTLSRNDDFSIAFDLDLMDIASGTEPGKTTSLEIGVGLYDFADATNGSFQRGVFGAAPSLVEFDYFTSGYYKDSGMTYDVNPTTTPVFISTNSYDYAPTAYSSYEYALPLNVTVRVTMSYTATNQTLTTSLSTNGVLFLKLPDVTLADTNDSGFGDDDDYRVDTFSVNNYSSAGDPYDSLLAHGTIGNLSITFPNPIQNFTGKLTNGIWLGSFTSRRHWLYTLQRTGDLRSWANVTTPMPGNAATLILPDPQPPASQAFYRISAVYQ